MRNTAFIVMGLVIFGCKSDSKQIVSEQPDIQQSALEFEWLIGNWIRVGEKEGNQTYEYWKRRNENTLIGLGCTLQGTDTIWREDVELIKRENGWNFEVVGLGDTVATVFELTQIEANKFVCENALNDFPKKIEYSFDGTNLNAVISGGGPDIPFNFVPLKQ